MKKNFEGTKIQNEGIKAKDKGAKIQDKGAKIQADASNMQEKAAIVLYERNSEQYDDIIDLPHPTSAKHPRMSMMARAAQFASFAALTGYEEAIGEVETAHNS